MSGIKKRRRKNPRLSFIGGRRPALLSASRISANNHTEVVDSVSKKVVPPENVEVEQEVSSNKTEEVINTSPDKTEEVINTSPDKNIKEAENATVSLKKTEDTNTTAILKKTQASSGRKSIEELEEVVRSIDSNQGNRLQNIYVNVKEELEKWKIVSKNKTLSKFLSQDLQCDVEVPFNFDYLEEIENLNEMCDKWDTTSLEIEKKHKELQLQQELMQRYLDTTYKTIEQEENYIVKKDHTPRHLIKRILNPN